jgi:hypothetical protein
MSLKFSGGHLRRVSYKYDLQSVLNFNNLADLALRLLTASRLGPER